MDNKVAIANFFLYICKNSKIMACIEDYPIIETAIEYGVKTWGKKEAMAIQIACFWIEGWLAAKTDLSEEDVEIIKQGVKNYCFF